MVSGNFVDMHVHSMASDGTRSAEEIATLASLNGVSILSVADHNTLTTQPRMVELCARLNIRYIPAVEIDTLSGRDHYHVLAYGIDLTDIGFRQWLTYPRYCLDEMSVRLIEKMARDYPSISYRSFTDFPDMAGYGGWKALHYMVSRGVAKTLHDGFRYYPEYGLSYEQAGFPTLHTTCDRIRRAGGYSVLAHPGETIKTDSIKDFKATIRSLVPEGIQGIECLYPTHSEEITKACLDLCKEKSLYITSGSDDHGSFGEAEIGQMKITQEQVRIRA